MLTTHPTLQMPNTYARGILFGKLILELCEMSSIVCAKNDLRADVDFKAKVSLPNSFLFFCFCFIFFFLFTLK